MLVEFKTITPCPVSTAPKGPTGLECDHISLPAAGSSAHHTKGRQNPKSTCTFPTDRNLHMHTLYTFISPGDATQLKLCITNL